MLLVPLWSALMARLRPAVFLKGMFGNGNDYRCYGLHVCGCLAQRGSANNV